VINESGVAPENADNASLSVVTESNDTETQKLDISYKEICIDFFTNLPKNVKNYLLETIKKPLGVYPRIPNPYKRPRWQQLILTFIAVFIGIGSASVGHFYILATLGTQVIQMMMGALGASAVLLYSEWKSPLAQPRHVFGGYIICGLTGTVGRIILFYLEVPTGAWVHPWVLTLTVCISILLMQLTRTTHPPGGAVTAIIMIGPLVSRYVKDF
jgi:CBS-domain-containing membrane protein